MTPPAPRHLLSLRDLSPSEAHSLLRRAVILKRLQKENACPQPLMGKTVAMIFEKPSTRTRVSFETGIYQLGGHPMMISSESSQLGRGEKHGETIEDTARVLSRMVDGIVMRTSAQNNVERLAAHASIPVINGLTDVGHPCQIMADCMTFMEHRGELAGKTFAWIGDANNVCNSLMEATQLFDFKLNIAAPEGYKPDPELLAATADHCTVMAEPADAVRGVNAVFTDVWTSMGQEAERASRTAVFQPYQVNQALMQLAAPDAVFMHCLPAHRGEEVTAEVIDGPQSIVWDEAENRLHIQKAILEFIFSQG